MKRTGLKQYIEQVQASLSDEEQTTKKAEAAPTSQAGQSVASGETKQTLQSLLDYPGMEQAIKEHILKHKHYQLVPVIDYVEHNLKKSLADKKLIPESIVSLPSKDDKKLCSRVLEIISSMVGGEMSDPLDNNAGHSGQTEQAQTQREFEPALENVEPHAE